MTATHSGSNGRDIEILSSSEILLFY